MKKLVILSVVALGAASAGGWWWKTRNGQAPPYRLGKIERGDLKIIVTATGTVQPITQVQVGTQVSGTVQKLMADFNSRVTAGQVVAQIDPAPFQARVDQDRANFARSEADVERVRAGLVQAQKELVRSQELAKRELISPSELDAAVASADSFAAQLKVAEATVAQSKATLAVSEVNLRYTTIVSPIDGIVISRNVDVGQTVAASLSAPTLFVIADSLKRVQIQASVAEADIGRIRSGGKVTFTVDAYRDTPFAGTVAQVRLSPTTVQNVVTYAVLIDADNPGEKLLPGMTVIVSFEVASYDGILKIPNAALRFVPPSEAGPSEEPRAADAPAPRHKHNGGGGGGGGRKHVWIQALEGPQEVSVETGATDGSFTQLVKGDLKEGQEVITGVSTAADAGGMTNPFAPRWGGGGGGGRR